MPRIRHIALLVPASGGYSRGVCRGVATFALDRDDWLIFPYERAEFTKLPPWLKKGHIDGIIGFISNPDLGRQITSLGVPIVDVQGEGNCPDFPWIDTDAEVVAGLAEDFFTQAGFAHFAFCGYPGVFFSDRRSDAFTGLVRGKGVEPHVYEPPPRVTTTIRNQFREMRGLEYEPALAAWLARLPKPVAILACNDTRGQQIITACRDLGISMPADVSVMGVDNDEILCRLCRPTLTSIAPDTEGIGILAGRLLNAILEGEAVEPRLYKQPPLRVVERESTDVTTAQNPLVLAASRVIRDRACRGISVEQVCELAGCSRSTLDGLFKKHLGRSIAGEMVRVRLGTAMRLLENTTLTLDEIATACGFQSATYFCRFFKRESGSTPAQYRSAQALR
ncbi:XylR family transcriptional regulator [Mesoterricola sediminis]|uniref:XylR family transcriptional regulator n=1 Tax=Mesoterricola sediminis TaxID=2927980 RepID=A0AA48HGX1_9BACT|nr:DNA-binding transcriptional regulator [Mesoterricola sediminis]BDU78003.1 XylR family transcriptional regulator [Mesoterricola sediminis]